MGGGVSKADQHPGPFYLFSWHPFPQECSKRAIGLMSGAGNSSPGSATEGWLVSGKSLGLSGPHVPHCYFQLCLSNSMKKEIGVSIG